MEQKYLWILTWTVGAIVTLWIVTDLMEDTMLPAGESKSANIRNEAFEYAEEDLGLEGGDTLSMPARAMRIARETQKKALEQQQRMKESMAEIEQMQRMDLEQMGADSATINSAGY
jgi:hypothetical protein